MTENPNQEKRSNSIMSTLGASGLIIIILVILIIGAATFAGFYFMNLRESQETEISPIPTITIFIPTETPTPASTTSASITPTKKLNISLTPTLAKKPTTSISSLDRSKLVIEIQNGSGVAGAAKKASDTLNNLGYKILRTRNADNYDYINTEILVKKEKSSYLEQLKQDLSDVYTIGNTSSTLSASESADAIVIVGKQ